MKKKQTFLILIVLVVILGIILFRLVDADKSLTLPIAQRIKTTLLQIGSKNKNATIDHFVIIMMENKSYSDIVGSKNAPYINSLIHEYSFADNYFAVSHPSLPNYMALIGGSTFNITSDCTDCYVNSTNLVDQLEQGHKTWKAYMESMPSACLVGNANQYAQKHNPFIYFDDIRNNKSRCNSVVPYTRLKLDFQSLSTTPNFAWISPNLCNDMHDCSVSQGDTWLSNQIPLILKSPAFAKQKSVLIITWDEGEDSGNNQVPTLVIGNSIKKGFASYTHYTHYSLLHTIEHVWNMPPLTINVSQSAIMFDLLNIANK